MRRHSDFASAMFHTEMDIHVKDIALDEYIRRFRDEKRIGALCRECPSYGTTWVCPPFDYDTTAELARWSKATIIACSFNLGANQIPLVEARETVAEKFLLLEPKMLALETEFEGRAFSFCGSCRRCAVCTRPAHKPCVLPSAARPSLESYGFDIVKTLNELFGIKLHWASAGYMPDTLTLVSALFHNRQSATAIAERFA